MRASLAPSWSSEGEATEDLKPKLLLFLRPNIASPCVVGGSMWCGQYLCMWGLLDLGAESTCQVRCCAELTRTAATQGPTGGLVGMMDSREGCWVKAWLSRTSRNACQVKSMWRPEERPVVQTQVWPVLTLSMDQLYLVSASLRSRKKESVQGKCLSQTERHKGNSGAAWSASGWQERAGPKDGSYLCN